MERDHLRYCEELRIAEEAEDVRGEATALNNLGTICIDRKNYQKALMLFQRAVACLEPSDSVSPRPPEEHVSVYGNAASAARGLADWDMALEYSLVAECLSLRHDLKHDLEILRVGIAIVHRELGEVAFADHLTRAQLRLPEDLQALARMELHLQPLQQATAIVDKGPGRNDPCPCGSGRKYKKCCGV